MQHLEERTATAVAEAAAILDGAIPTWAHDIDRDVLDMMDCNTCIGGQLDWPVEIRNIDGALCWFYEIDTNDADSDRWGVISDACWRREIQQRTAAPRASVDVPMGVRA